MWSKWSSHLATEGERMAKGELLLPRRSTSAIASLRCRSARRRSATRQLRGAAGAVAREASGAERVGVWAESTLETCVAIVGALAAGAAVVPVNPKLGEAELRHVLEDSRPELLFGAPRRRARAGATSRPGSPRST